MVDIVNSDPNLKSPHQYGPAAIFDLLYDYYVKQQYPGAVGPFGIREMSNEEGNVERPMAEEEARREGTTTEKP